MKVGPTPREPSLGEELRASALLFGLALGCTVGVATVSHLVLRFVAP